MSMKPSEIKSPQSTVACALCPHRCTLREGALGFCRARKAEGGKIVPLFYGKLSSLALDPIEKKPLLHFYPGKNILSVGSLGCNMRCPFCQNYEISQCDEATAPLQTTTRKFEPEELIKLALQTRAEENIGLAFTYNEPLVNFEFVLDTAKLARDHGLETVLVSNGQINPEPLEELLPHLSALNIDLKCFSEEGYRSLGGDFQTTLNTIRKAAASGAHVEITSLIVPGLSDSTEAMEKEAAFLAAINPDIPLHLSRYFPRYKAHEKATDLTLLKELQNIAEKKLRYVHLGNVF